jgi:hypothetical protein
MFTKRVILASLVALAMILPTYSFAHVWLYYDSGTPQSVWGDATNGKHMAVKYLLCGSGLQNFRTDSVKLALYKFGTGTSVTFKIHLREDNLNVNSAGCPSGPVDCAGPGTIKWSSGNITRTQASGWAWHTVDVADCVMIADFIVDIQIVSGGTSVAPLMDNTPPIPCCEGYLYWNNAWDEHYDYWGGPEGVGHYMIRVKGDTLGGCDPAFYVSKTSLFFGHALTRWVGDPPDPEPITHYGLIVKNTGGGTLTVSNIALSSGTYFYWTGDALPWSIPGMQEKTFDVTFQTPDVGLKTDNLIFTHNASGSPDTTVLSGIGYGGHWLENFYEPPDPLNGDWWIQQDSCADEPWYYYSGGYSDQSSCTGHQYSDAGCFSIDWQASSPFRNPDNAGVQVRWMNEDRNSYSYYYHGFYWTAPDCTQYHWVAEIGPTTESAYEEVGPYYVNAPSDSIQLAYLYVGEDADSWFLDDIRADSIPALPPELSHEHHTDDGPATWTDPDCVYLTCRAIDPNNDPVTVTVWYKDHAAGSWSSTAMWAVTGCEDYHLYQALICDLEVCHSYDYYFQADDDDAGTPTTYLPANAPTTYYTLDIMDNTKPQLSYDNGTAWYVRYNPTYWEERFAVQFTPGSYPYTLGGAMVRIGAAYQSFPDDDHEDIVVELYDDNGAGGKPGTMIGTAYPNNGTSWNEGEGACDDTTFASWVYVKIDPCVTITDGNFYIAVRNRDGSEGADKEAFAYDSGPAASPYRTWIFYADQGQWGLDTLGDASDPPGESTNLMIRAIECACVPSAPTNLTAIYSGGNVQLRWSDIGQNQSYKIYRSLTDPFSGFALLATVGTGVQYYADPIGANTKAFYRIQGSCDPPAFAPPVPPTEEGTMAIGPVRRVPSNLPATFTVGQHMTLEQQLRSGILPKHINKSELQTISKTMKITPSWNFR